MEEEKNVNSEDLKKIAEEEIVKDYGRVSKQIIDIIEKKKRDKNDYDKDENKEI